MGGGGSWKIGQSDLGKLERVVSESMKPGGVDGRRNVFLSFEYGDVDRVNLLRGQAKNENSGLEFNDWSLREPFDSANADYIKRGIKERIRQSSVTLVFVGEDTHRSRWVDWEIRASHELGKRVVAMHTAPNVRQPAALQELGIKSVPWTHAALMKVLGG